MEGAPYTEKVIEYFQNPKNVGEIEDPDGYAKEGSPACGDMVELFLKVDDDTHEIKDIKFKSYGCASNIATGSIITEMAMGSTIEEAKDISWQEAADELGGLPDLKTHCSVLAVDALREAIRNYEERQGIGEGKKETTAEVVKERLKHVMNPMTGVDVIQTDLIHDIEVEDGKISIEVDLEEDHQFASAVKEDIKEKLEPRWDVEEVKVHFGEK
ncbi:MAG: iron-sulfur cluster assembly scaffold protein [Candidatus Thermoplasmatota archaeon]